LLISAALIVLRFTLQAGCTFMQTKGGYSESEIRSHLNLIDLPKRSWYYFRYGYGVWTVNWCLML